MLEDPDIESDPENESCYVIFLITKCKKTLIFKSDPEDDSCYKSYI